MKQYAKNWITAFTISLLVCISLVLAFILYLNLSGKDGDGKNEPDKNNVTALENTPSEFTDVEDNVGAVSFTEDQITELARKIFFLDGFLSNVSVDLNADGSIGVQARIKDKDADTSVGVQINADGSIGVQARIKDKDALIKQYPELEKYGVLLSAMENRKIEVSGGLEDRDGSAAFVVESVKVAGLPIDKAIISPFLEEDDFSELFSVDYDSIEIDDGIVVFKNGVPDLLQY